MHKLETDVISEVVTRRAAGVYVLYRDMGGAACYVGRSDHDLAERLRQHARTREYRFFTFEYASSARAAFEAECAAYHRYATTLDNAVHPARPQGTDWFCPRCGRF